MSCLHHSNRVVNLDSELEEARPSSIGEEEMQLQIALALSREECEKEEEMRKGDAIRLQMALEESKKNPANQEEIVAKTVTGASLTQSALDDLLSLNLGEPAPMAGPSGLGTSAATANNDPWSPVSSTPQSNDPWSPVKKPEVDPCKSFYLVFIFQSLYLVEALLGSGPVNHTPTTNFSNDPWSPAAPVSVATPILAPAQNDPWAAFESSAVATPGTPTSNNSMHGALNGGAMNGSNGAPMQRNNVKTPESFLGENSSLVNLDNLMGPPAAQNKAGKYHSIEKLY